jgi:AcrR family transcriptional regulator
MAQSVRSEREKSILEAALFELDRSEVSEITMSAIAARTGLTRTGIYQYFSSVDDIFAELVINDMADLVNQIEIQVSNQVDPIEKIRVWAHYSLAHLSTGEHATVRRLSEINLAAEKRGIVRALHAQFMQSLLNPIKELQFNYPEAVCAHISSVVNSAANRIDLGMDFAHEAKAAEEFIMSAILRL